MTKFVIFICDLNIVILTYFDILIDALFWLDHVLLIKLKLIKQASVLFCASNRCQHTTDFQLPRDPRWSDKTNVIDRTKYFITVLTVQRRQTLTNSQYATCAANSSVQGLLNPSLAQMVLDGLGDTFRALLCRIIPYRREEILWVSLDHALMYTLLIMALSLLVVVPIGTSWHTSPSPLHTWFYDIHSANRTAACWSANIILPSGNLQEICRHLCGPTNRWMVPPFRMVLQRGLCLVGIKGSGSE